MKNRLGDREMWRLVEHRALTLIASALLICLIVSTGYAQRATGTISGQVIGDSGQPIPNAKVSVTGVGGISKIMSGRMEIVTDEAGGFQADELDPAAYSVSATAPG